MTITLVEFSLLNDEKCVFHGRKATCLAESQTVDACPPPPPPFLLFLLFIIYPFSFIYSFRFVMLRWTALAAGRLLGSTSKYKSLEGSSTVKYESSTTGGEVSVES